MIWLLAALLGLAPPPVDLRLENFAVTPSTGPVVNALVRNRGDRAVDAVVSVQWPAGWTAEPATQTVHVAPGATVAAPFALTKAVDLEANRYAVTVEAVVEGQRLSRAQQVVCATAPNLKPVIDGRLDDWRDGVPLTWNGTTVLAGWSRERVCLAVRTPGAIDAVQVALSTMRAAAAGRAGRYEFLLKPGAGDGPGSVYRLLVPADSAELAATPRELAPLACPEAECRVRRDGADTIVELGLPVTLVAELRPTTGRAFRGSVLVHAGDALRDLGDLMNLWPDQRRPVGWCRWPGERAAASAAGNGAAWEPLGEFGFSSSIH